MDLDLYYSTMKLFILLTGILIFSCRTGASLPDDNHIVNVLNNYIEEDSLYSGNISSSLLPYFYYSVQYSDDGNEIPPPPVSLDGEFLDENKVIERTGEERYFSKKDAGHIKYQLLKSKRISSSHKAVNLSKAIKRNEEGKTGSEYNFYVPIYNRDSSAVYVQYDYFIDFSNGYGNGAILVRDNGKWKMVKWIDRWMN